LTGSAAFGAGLQRLSIASSEDARMKARSDTRLGTWKFLQFACCWSGALHCASLKHNPQCGVRDTITRSVESDY